MCQALVSASGNLASLPATLRALAAQGTAEHPAWLEVTVQDDDYLPDLAPRIEAMVQDLPLEVLRVKRQRGTATPGLWAEDAASLHELSPREVFARRLAQETLDSCLRDIPGAAFAVASLLALFGIFTLLGETLLARLRAQPTQSH